MLKHRSLSATAATFFFLLVGAAHADVAGSWKLAAGSAEPCALTLDASGAATGCVGIAKWKANGTGINLFAADDTLVGILKSKGDAYEGRRVSDSRKLTLSH